MKLFGATLQLKKNKQPTIASVNPIVFDIHRSWRRALILSGVLILLGVIVGLKLFWNIYFEQYRNGSSDLVEEIGGDINVNRLTHALERRAMFLTAPTSIPSDPSL